MPARHAMPEQSEMLPSMGCLGHNGWSSLYGTVKTIFVPEQFQNRNYV